MTAEKKRTLALVVRVSDVKGRDRDGDRFISPDQQVRDASAYARAAEFAVRVIEPKDLNVSHTTPLDDRPAMGAALRLVETGELGGIVVSSQDRLGTLELTRELKRRLLEAGAVLKVADNPGAEVLDAKGYLKIPSDLMSLVHEAQREEMGLRWDKAKRRAVLERGIHFSSTVPAGYDRPQLVEDGKPVYSASGRPVRGRLVPNEHAAAVRRAFALRAAGGSWRQVCDLLAAAGVPNKAGEPYWTRSAAWKLVQNRVYLGEARYGPYVNPEAHPAIVEGATFRRVQELRGRPVARTSQAALLGGLVVCAGCGRKLSPSLGDGRYRCRPGVIAGLPCTEPASAPARDLEALVEQFFLANIPFYLVAPEAGPDLSMLEGAIVAAKARLQAFVGSVGDVVVPGFAEEAKKRQHAVEVAEDALRAASLAAGTATEAASLQEHWLDLDVIERREWLKRFGVRVSVRRGRQPIGKRIAEISINQPAGLRAA